MSRWKISIAVMLVIGVVSAAPAVGAAPTPATVAARGNDTNCPPGGHWFVGPDGVQRPAPDCPPTKGTSSQSHSTNNLTHVPSLAAATGGPDDYGYAWDDSEPFNWIDATSGTDTGMSGNSYGNAVAVSLPFAFKYYENTFSTVYIAAPGYLSFDNNSYWPDQEQVPSPETPNNVIAPYWSPFNLNGSGPAGRVFYASGGSAPNRYLVVEWNQVASATGLGDNGKFSFELVLHENGDIVFQYGTMNYGQDWWCGDAGIEDSAGLDGLNYLPFCQKAASNIAVRFHRPAPQARVKVYPFYQGQFSQLGGATSFAVPIRNLGELGTDTYDITYSSPWPVSLFQSDGVTPLTDTGGDPNPDTGPVAQGDTTNIVVKVQVPGGAVPGSQSSASLMIQSAVDATQHRSITLQTGIPTQFAQVYNDYSIGGLSLYLAGPNAQAVTQATADYRSGSNTAVAEAPNGNFVYAWDSGHCVGTNCSLYVDEVQYAILNANGEVVQGTNKLVDNSSAFVTTYDSAPALAVAPDNHIGVIWLHELSHYTGSTWQYNYNVLFAILDSAGNRVAGPIKLTNNNAWFDYSHPGIDWMGQPAISATGDNRFVLAWQRETYAGNGCSSYCYPDEVQYAALTTGGATVKAATLLAPVAAGHADSYFGPGLTRLAGNRALLTFEQQADAKFIVLDSAGNTVQGKTNITTDGNNQYNYDLDAVQLSSGNIVVGWTTSNGPNILFAVLNSSYSLISGPTTLSNPAAVTGGDYVSVAADGAGHAVLTWMDANYYYQRNMYYALVNSDGSILNQPMIFRTSAYGFSNLFASYIGNGVTSYSSTPEAGVDTWVRAPALKGATPGGVGGLSIQYGNHGTTTATSVWITATLGGSLTYLSDTSGVSPMVSSNHVAWNLPDLAWLNSRQFDVTLGIPNVAYGTVFPVGLVVGSSAPDANPADNAQNISLYAAHQLFLPSVNRVVQHDCPPVQIEIEPNTTFGAAQSICANSAGVAIYGQFDIGGTQDVYKLPLTAGQTIAISLLPQNRLATALRLYLQDGNHKVAGSTNPDANGNFYITYPVQTTGTYFINPYGPPSNALYTLTVKVTP